MPPEEGSKGNESAIPAEIAAQFAKFGEQVENLNKAVKEAREDSRVSKEATKEWQTKYEELAKMLDKGGSADDLDISAEELEKFKKFAEKNGLVTKEDLKEIELQSNQKTLVQIENQAVEEFLEKYPEFEDDDEFAKLKEEFQLYKQPTNLADYRKLLAKIYKDLKGDDKAEGAAEARAERHKRERLGEGGKSPASSGDSELDELAKRYPNLSKDQLKERLAEINALYQE